MEYEKKSGKRRNKTHVAAKIGEQGPAYEDAQEKTKRFRENVKTVFGSVIVKPDTVTGSDQRPEHIEQRVWILENLKECQDKGFFGEITITMQNGSVHCFKKSETLKYNKNR